MGNRGIHKSKAQQTGEIGHSAIELIFKRQGWTVVTIPGGDDFGEDQLVRVFIDGQATELNFYVQVKAREKAKKLQTIDAFSIPIKTDLLDVWYGYTVPVFLILWDENAENGYWIEINEYVAKLNVYKPSWLNQKTITINIPAVKMLNKDGLIEIEKMVKQFFFNKAIEKRGGLVITTTFSFSNDEFGKQAQTEFEEHIKTGKPVTVKNPYIQSIKFENWHKRIMGIQDLDHVEFLSIEPRPSDEKYTAILEIFDNNDDLITKEVFIFRIKQQGTEEITLVNDESNSIIILTVVGNKNSKSVNLNVRYRFGGTTTSEVKKYIEFIKAIHTKSRTVLTFIEMNSKIIDSKGEIFSDKRIRSTIETIEKLIEIAQKFNTIITIPDEGFSVEVIEDINYLYDVISQGKVKRKYKELPVTVHATKMLETIEEYDLGVPRILCKWIWWWSFWPTVLKANDELIEDQGPITDGGIPLLSDIHRR